MIDFSKFPRTEETTYTIIHRYQAGELRTALRLAGETDWQIRTCKSHDKSMLNDIKEHLPEWFDARYSVLVSHFMPECIEKNIEKICDDPDVNKIIDDKNKKDEKDYMRYEQWMRQTKGRQ